MTHIIVILILVFAFPALAQDKQKDIVVHFTEQEITAQMQLNDAALKSLGGPAAQAFVVLDTKYKAAMQAAQKQDKRE